jgi:hypothetical protein
VSVETTAAVSQETVATITPGDAVELAVDDYEWQLPLDVVDAHDAIEWDVPLGDDWWTRTIIVEGGNGGQYAICYDDDGETADAVCYRQADGGVGDKRGDVVHFALAEADDQHDHECPDCGDRFETGQHLAGHRNNPHTSCSPAGSDPDEHEKSDGISETDVEDVVDEHTHLNDIADALGIKPGRARSKLVHLNLYSEVREGSRGGR